MSKWSKWSNINAQKLNEESKSLKSGEYKDVPDGKYECSLESLVFTESKAGNPMLKADFKILKGEFERHHMFVNQVVLSGNENDHKKVAMAKNFLRSLDTGHEVEFEGLEEFEALVDEIFAAVKSHGLEYEVELKTNGEFKNYYITDVYE